jgi:hypothetical protein
MWAIVDDGQAPNCCPMTTTFAGGVWSSGAPSEEIRAVIDENYDTAIHGDIYACAVQVKPGVTLTVRAGDYVITINTIEVMGMLDVQTFGVVFAGF